MPIAEKYLRILLWLIALHSFVAGTLLIVLGGESMRFFGFETIKTFFQVQGGVFHIVMCVAYLLAAWNVRKHSGLIIFIITAKFIAMVYLVIYYVMVEAVITILLSGLGDGLMGLMVLWLWSLIKQDKSTGEDNV